MLHHIWAQDTVIENERRWTDTHLITAKNFYSILNLRFPDLSPPPPAKLDISEAEGSCEQRKSRRKQTKVSSGMRWMALSSLIADRALSALECEADSSSPTAIACAASPPMPMPMPMPLPLPSSCCPCCCLGLAERLSCLCIFGGAR